MNIYVGNLSYQVTEEELGNAFRQFGDVTSATIIMDKLSGKSKGFGFVEMPDATAAETAIKQLDGTALRGRNIKVNKAKPREDRSARKPYRY